VAPLDRANVDTDQIIPKEYLKSIKRTGYAEGLFAAWRHDPQFVLNRPQYKGASILLARKNFGCGSSREHAPWALMEYGFRCVIAPSFADIFFTNSFKNGFLPVALREDEVDKLFYEAASFPGFRLIVNVENQVVETVDGAQSMRFDIDPFRKYCLLNGLDEIGLTLRHADKIRAFEDRRQTQFPWYF
jgi:3-isopropylmalate/(R)-2-methylmalate dehydratase small subunit